MEDFVKEQIEGPGLISQETINMEFSITSDTNKSAKNDQKHESANMISDTRLQINPVSRGNVMFLARNITFQEDWLRVNFSLFKLTECLYTNKAFV